MSRKKRLWTLDSETDPFKHGRVPEPFIWCAYDGSRYEIFHEVQELVDWISEENGLFYAHNGGRFDFMFLLQHCNIGRLKIIKSRVVEIHIGNSTLRDSWSIIPIALKDYQKTDIEYWKMERECRNDHWREITDYLRDDCRHLFNLVSEYRRQAGGRLTIAGNALQFATKRCDITIGRTSKKFDDKFRPFYFGGRCQAFKQGVFRDVDIYDIKSAYPNAMMQEHPHGVDYAIRENPLCLSLSRLQNCFLVLTCFSNGAFAKRDGLGLTFPTESGTFYTTGWEFCVAVKHNLISEVVIHKCLEFYDTINFVPYVNHWFAHKQKADAEGDKANRIIGKIMLNSLYGKLAQNPTHYQDYVICERDTPIDTENGWKLDYEFGEKELHTRPTMWRLQKENPDTWKDFPVFYNVATGASITGHCRSVVLDAIHTVGRENVIYCDTDCLFLSRGADISLLDTSGQLGSWGHEGNAEVAYIGGKKLYAATGDFGKGKTEKIATKGFKATVAKIKDIVAGKEFEWKSEAPNFALDGTARFTTRKIRRTAV